MLNYTLTLPKRLRRHGKVNVRERTMTYELVRSSGGLRSDEKAIKSGN